jgi:diguanylate cyclase (GGDEF)-like protein
MMICFSIVVIRNLVDVMRQNDYLEEVVIKDHLTDLHNRYYINNLLNKGFKVEKGRQLYVLFIDLNKFKAINDEYGHKVGDIILQESSKKLKDCFHRDSDILCRYGGDEFLAFVNVKDVDGNIEGIINRIKKKFEEPIV